MSDILEHLRGIVKGCPGACGTEKHGLVLIPEALLYLRLKKNGSLFWAGDRTPLGLLIAGTPPNKDRF